MDEQSERIAWHYTTGDRFEQIVESGYLYPATANVPKHERPIVWFSLNQEWEETACKMEMGRGRPRRLNRGQTRKKGRGLVRFGLPAQHLVGWPEVASEARITEAMRIGLERAARKQGADPNEWMGSFEPIAIYAPEVRVHVEERGNWIPVGKPKGLT